MENVLLQACVYLSAAVIAVPLSQRLGLGSVLGYLLAGVFISPILHLIGSNTEQIQHYAEFGIVIMLFLIGLEMRPQRIWEMRESLVGLGGLQIFLTTSILTFIAIILGLPWQTSLATAMILSLSSTAIVLQTLTEKKLQNSDGGKSAIAILLMQDIAVIPMLAILPLLATQELQVDALLNAVLNGREVVEQTISNNVISQLPGWASAIAIASAILIIILSGRYLTEPIITYISKYGTREIFLAATFLMIILVAFIMTLVGLSPALGTFLVGLVLSNSKYRHALASDLDPFKGLLLGLFFITVGAGINFGLLIQNFSPIIMLTLCLIITKGTILFILAKVFLLRKNSSILIALYLSQAGEFGFVLLGLAKTAHVVPAYVADNLSLTIALSMLITPVLFFLVQKMKLSDFSKPIDKVSSDNEDGTKIIIIEMSKFGKVASEILIKSGYNVMILDNSSSKVAAFRKEGIKAFSGDTSNPDLLIKAGIQNTEVVIVACQDPEKSIAITDHIINKYPSIKLIVTAIDKEHYKALYDCGAREIILETYYNSILACEKTLLALGEDTSQVKRTLKDFETTDFANLINRTSYKR